ncbi:unnamed protein product [Heterobilharzia americana]|nr:unnamed protein product [Heterobilharzia americana]
MEPIISHGDNFSFLRRIIEKIKYARDALHPDDTISNEKLYTVCDISLGLLLSRCVNPTVKEYPVDVKLPKTLFIPTPADFRNPDFKQLMSMTMESKTDTSVDIVHSSMETPETSVRSKIQPVLQFTPKKACKEGLIPTELLKTKRAGISKTKTQAKACSQSEGIKKAKSESKSTKHDNELSGQESTDHSEVTMLENNKELEEVVDVVPTSISSDRNVFEENFSPPCVPSRRKKRPNKTTPENTKRLRTNKSPVFTPHENQSTLDCVVISKASSDKGPPQTNNTNLQPSNVSPRKIEKQLTKAVSKPRPPNSSKSSIQATKNRSNNIRCVKKDTHALPIPPSGDRKVSLRSINSKTAEGMEKLTIERTRNPQSAAKAPVRIQARHIYEGASENLDCTKEVYSHFY